MESVVTIAAATASHISLVQQLAHEIWRRHYPGILSVAQIDYMLERGYARDALLPSSASATPAWRLRTLTTSRPASLPGIGPRLRR